MPCKLKKKCRWSGDFLAVPHSCCDFFLNQNRLKRSGPDGTCLEFEPRKTGHNISREFTNPTKIYRAPVPRMGRPYNPELYVHMRRLYDACMNDVEIAKSLGITSDTVYKWRKRHNLPSMYDLLKQKYSKKEEK